jgi:putative tryptophan/tyrosine transport system substrate-binding protein
MLFPGLAARFTIMERTLDRRQLIISAGAALAFGARPGVAQTSADKPKRIGLMIAIGEADPEGQERVETFVRSLEKTGWTRGQNVTVDVDWYSGNFQRAQAVAKKYVDDQVDVIVVNGTPGMDALRGLQTSIPIVFVVVSDPVGAGYVPNLSRPGANVTGFSTFEPEIAGKWLQLLKRIAPDTKNVSVLLDPKYTAFNSLWLEIENTAPQQGIVPHAAFASSLAEIERALETVSKQDSPGLIVSPSPVNTVNRKHIIDIVNARRVPAIFPFRFYVRDGALMAYGFNAADQFRRAAAYVDRILKGEKPGDLPVQGPISFEFGINLKTARAMGFAVPQSLLIAADEIVQ